MRKGCGSRKPWKRQRSACWRGRSPTRALQTNVELNTALLLEALGFPREAFTSVFAAGRVGGWIAHARERIQAGRLIRPQSRYVGPQPAPLMSPSPRARQTADQSQ